MTDAAVSAISLLASFGRGQFFGFTPPRYERGGMPPAPRLG
jgi:hypothetical protein